MVYVKDLSPSKSSSVFFDEVVGQYIWFVYNALFEFWQIVILEFQELSSEILPATFVQPLIVQIQSQTESSFRHKTQLIQSSFWLAQKLASHFINDIRKKQKNPIYLNDTTYWLKIWTFS